MNENEGFDKIAEGTLEGEMITKLGAVLDKADEVILGGDGPPPPEVLKMLEERGFVEDKEAGDGTWSKPESGDPKDKELSDRTKAIALTKARIVENKKIGTILEQLLASLETPMEQRTPMNTLKEMILITVLEKML